ncbi:hypothetical protein OH77DRAFT_999633 [Trametes cingulata]|nr:hypothetical protein OH77DRAFT_999633 [Trametes cingulata]
MLLNAIHCLALPKLACVARAYVRDPLPDLLHAPPDPPSGQEHPSPGASSLPRRASFQRRRILPRHFTLSGRCVRPPNAACTARVALSAYAENSPSVRKSSAARPAHSHTRRESVAQRIATRPSSPHTDRRRRIVSRLSAHPAAPARPCVLPPAAPPSSLRLRGLAALLVPRSRSRRYYHRP